MSEKYLDTAQQFLTQTNGDGERLIIGIRYLSENHSPEEIIRYLRDYLKGKEKELKDLILGDKSSPLIDQTIAIVFRVHMAIMTLEREVNKIVRFKQGTGSGRSVHKRHRRRHSHSRLRKDKDHDGEDWKTRDRSWRVA